MLDEYRFDITWDVYDSTLMFNPYSSTLKSNPYYQPVMCNQPHPHEFGLFIFSNVFWAGYFDLFGMLIGYSVKNKLLIHPIINFHLVIIHPWIYPALFGVATQDVSGTSWALCCQSSCLPVRAPPNNNCCFVGRGTEMPDPHVISFDCLNCTDLEMFDFFSWNSQIGSYTSWWNHQIWEANHWAEPCQNMSKYWPTDL